MKIAMKKADKLWADLVKERDGWMCQWFKAAPHHAAPQGLHAHHIFGRSRRPTRHMLENGITLCMGHHVGPHGAHANPLEFAEMMRDRLGADEYDELRRLSLRTKVSA